MPIQVTIPPDLLLLLGASERAGNHTRWAGPLSQTATTHEINTIERLSHWMGQLAHESARFNATIEGASGADYQWRCSLANYMEGDGRRFKGGGITQITGRYNYAAYSRYVRHVYGPDAPDFLQQPERIRQLPWAADSAGWYWRNGYAERSGPLAYVGVVPRHRCQERGRWVMREPSGGPAAGGRDLNTLADAGLNDAHIRAVTRGINGGVNGLADRIAKTRAAHRYISIHWNEIFREAAGVQVPTEIQRAQEELNDYGSLFFRRMSAAIETNIFTQPKLMLNGSGIPDLADYLDTLSRKLAGEAGTPKPDDSPWTEA